MKERMAPADRAPSTSGIRVLVVDDEEPVRKFITRVLTDAGFQTQVASSGPEAIKLASGSGPFDLILTDLVMPEMSGDEVVRSLRGRWPELKVLYLTGHSDRLFDERSTLWADEAFLDKPCGVKSLLQAISLLVFSRVDLPMGEAPGFVPAPSPQRAQPTRFPLD
jgi:CheY-like chemotaxis protein